MRTVTSGGKDRIASVYPPDGKAAHRDGSVKHSSENRRQCGVTCVQKTDLPPSKVSWGFCICYFLQNILCGSWTWHRKGNARKNIKTGSLKLAVTRGTTMVIL